MLRKIKSRIVSKFRRRRTADPAEIAEVQADARTILIESATEKLKEESAQEACENVKSPYATKAVDSIKIDIESVDWRTHGERMGLELFLATQDTILDEKLEIRKQINIKI